MTYIVYYVKIYTTKKESEGKTMKAFYITLLSFADTPFKVYALIETIANNAELAEDDYREIFKMAVAKMAELREVPEELTRR